MKKIDRAEFLKQASLLGLAAIGGSSLLASCSESEEKKKKKPEIKMAPKAQPKAEPAPVTDESTAIADCSSYNQNLTEADLSARKNLGYIDQSEKADQNCKNCSFWQPEKYDGPCGGCKLIPNGAVTPQGWCNTWVAIPS